MPDFSVDPNAERRQHLSQLLYKLMKNQITVADLDRIPKKKLQKVAEAGFIKLQHGRYEEAKQIFESLAGLDHLNGYYRSALGAVFQKQGKMVDAVIEYSQALTLNPADMASTVNRGEIFLRTKNYKKAAEDFRAAILSDPNGRNLWSNRARSLVIALKRNLDLKKGQAKRVKKVVSPKSR